MVSEPVALVSLENLLKILSPHPDLSPNCSAFNNPLILRSYDLDVQ